MNYYSVHLKAKVKVVTSDPESNPESIALLVSGIVKAGKKFTKAITAATATLVDDGVYEVLVDGKYVLVDKFEPEPGSDWSELDEIKFVVCEPFGPTRLTINTQIIDADFTGTEVVRLPEEGS
jgi:hypothetical protein